MAKSLSGGGPAIAADAAVVSGGARSVARIGMAGATDAGDAILGLGEITGITRDAGGAGHTTGFVRGAARDHPMPAP